MTLKCWCRKSDSEVTTEGSELASAATWSTTRPPIEATKPMNTSSAST
jgi:hypothetical protein